MTALREASLNWAIGVLATFFLLTLMAYLDSKHSETGALQLSAEISTERAAEFAAINKE
jgi:hypothetical protein